MILDILKLLHPVVHNLREDRRNYVISKFSLYD